MNSTSRHLHAFTDMAILLKGGGQQKEGGEEGYPEVGEIAHLIKSCVGHTRGGLEFRPRNRDKGPRCSGTWSLFP